MFWQQQLYRWIVTTLTNSRTFQRIVHSTNEAVEKNLTELQKNEKINRLMQMAEEVRKGNIDPQTARARLEQARQQSTTTTSTSSSSSSSSTNRPSESPTTTTSSSKDPSHEESMKKLGEILERMKRS